jgi:outer membrane protein TolC
MLGFHPLFLPLRSCLYWLLLMPGLVAIAQPTDEPIRSPTSAVIDDALLRDLPLPGALRLQNSSPESLRFQLQTLEARWKALCDQYDRRPQVSLLKALEIGLSSNPVLAQNFAEISAAEWTTTAVRREWFPALYFTQPNNAPWAAAVATQNGNQSTSTTSSEYQKVQQFYTSPRLTMRWTFLDPTRVPRLGADLSTLQSKRLLFDVSVRNLILDIQESYYSLQEARELRGLYNHLFALTHAQLRRAQQFRAKGVDNQGDVSQLRAQLLAQLIQMIELFQQEITAANSLSSNMSLPPGVLNSPADQLVPVQAWATPLQITIDGALQMREEIRANLAQSQSYSWKSLALMQRYLPQIALMGQSQMATNDQLQLSSGSGRGFSSSSSANLRNSLGLTFNWLMYDGGIDSANASALRQQAASSDAAAASSRLAVTLEIQDNYASFLTNQIIIDTARDQVYAARDALADATRNYNGTTMNATTYIQIMQNYANAVRNYKASVKRFNIAVDSLYRNSAQLPPMAVKAMEQSRLSLQAPPYVGSP